MTGARPRSAAIDAVRVVSVVAIVAGHVWTTDGVARWFFLWHVPVFFMLTGYLWNEARSLQAEARRRSETLLRPYVSWLLLVVCAVIIHWAATREGAVIGSVGGAVLGGGLATRPFTTFWFVTALFFAVLLCRWLAGQHCAVIGGVLGAGVVAADLAGRYLSYVPLSVGLAWPCAVFVMAGILLRRYRDRLRSVTWVAAIVLVAAAVGIGADLLEPLNIKSGNFGQPALGFVAAAAVSAALIVLAESALRGLGGRVSASVTTLASTALVVVLLHPVVLWLLRTPESGTWLHFTVALAVPAVLGLVLVRSPLAGWLTGVVQPRVATEAR